MALQLKQQAKLSQQLVMTPQLQQAIKLLQLSRLELLGVVQKELQENPVLEEVGEGEEDHSSDSDHSPAATLADATEATLAAPSDTGSGEAPSEGEPSDAEKIADIDWQNYMDARPHTGMREVGGDADRPGIDQTHSRRESLTDHLEWQLQLARAPIEEEVAAHFIIGNIDERGYLGATVEEIAIQSGVREDVVEAALALVQSFEQEM